MDKEKKKLLVWNFFDLSDNRPEYQTEIPDEMVGDDAGKF